MSVELPPGDPVHGLPTAQGASALSGSLRATAEDFVVEEDLGYVPSGAGEHVFITVRKTGRNTHEVARALARLAGVPQVAVGYAGLKDRQAVTTQSFTVHLPGRDIPDFSPLIEASLQVLDVQRHHRKIRRGGLRGNRFVIRINGIGGDRALAEHRLETIRACGVPNYFGSQRFGRDGNNLRQVDDLFHARGRRPNRELRGLLLSAARAHLFNQVLAARVSRGTWRTAGVGDVIMLAGSGRQFAFDPDDDTIPTRIDAMDLHSSGPLCGRPGRSLRPSDEVLVFEQAVLAAWRDWSDGLVRFGLDEDRRALRLVVDGLTWCWADDALELRFGLTAGAYATAVLRELVSVSE